MQVDVARAREWRRCAPEAAALGLAVRLEGSCVLCCGGRAAGVMT